jgi:hypothetical protein
VTEDKPIVSIPPIARLGIVSVQLQRATVLVQVEHVRIAVAIGYVCDAIYATVPVISREDAELYFISDRKSLNIAHQIYFFLGTSEKSHWVKS